jgi:2'-5' RNA ligase
MSRIRTFVAAEPTDEIRSKAEKLVRQLAGHDDGIRWVQPENIHLTLKFLGDVEDREIYSVCSAVKQATSNCQAFELSCRGVGAFPSLHHPRTIWLGVQDAEARLAALYSEVQDSLCNLGFAAESRRFHGHLTLGRVQANRLGQDKLREVIEANSDTVFGPLAVDELIVYASELSRDGPNYTVLGRCPLG